MEAAQQWLQWLCMISLVMGAITLLAWLPMPNGWRETFDLPKRPLGGKKLLMMTAILLFATWLFAWLPAHTHTPIIRVNLTAVDQLLLGGLSLFMLVVMIQRIRQYNNMLSLLYCFTKHFLPDLLFIIRIVMVALGRFIIEVLKDLDSMNKIEEKMQKEQEEENRRRKKIFF